MVSLNTNYIPVVLPSRRSDNLFVNSTLELNSSNLQTDVLVGQRTIRFLTTDDKVCGFSEPITALALYGILANFSTYNLAIFAADLIGGGCHVVLGVINDGWPIGLDSYTISVNEITKFTTFCKLGTMSSEIHNWKEEGF